MKIQIICVGKLKEKYWDAAVAEYVKRISKYAEVTVTEVKEARLPDKASAAEERQAVAEEGQAILKHVKDGCYVIALEIEGRALSSEELAAKTRELMVGGRSHLAFVIGGSLGLSPEVSRRADFALSFSRMTFPHQMMRVILLEQIYRAFKINNNETYHK